ncbi:MAG: T9SS type A sorting domain-containing protein [Bacteroidales bacterium]|jgi:hypothetical protein|nr:T9SS type A sorting domain-containing protein [Bacteroidales bacterium]
MKKLFFILVICLITLSSKFSYSQVNNTVSLDSLTNILPHNVPQDITDTLCMFHRIEIYSSLNSVSDSIIEKGIHIKSDSEWTDIPFYSFQDSMLTEAYVSIFNQEFDTIIYFIPNLMSLLFQSYIITTIDTFYSDTIIRTELVEVGLKEIPDFSLDIKIYPTLFDKEINISSDKYPINLSVIDLFGREVLRKEINNNKAIDLNFLKKGTYILKLQYKDAIINRKIIKK